jgi:hypothetical protein
MKKFMTLPIVAGLAAQPVAAPSGALFVTAGAAITAGGMSMLGGCARAPGTTPIDISSLDIGVEVTRIVRTACGVVPVASTISAILVALALPAATPLQQQAALAAQAICDQVNRARTLRSALRQSVAPDGRPAVSYGPILINGHPIDVLVYAQ